MAPNSVKSKQHWQQFGECDVLHLGNHNAPGLVENAIATPMPVYVLDGYHPFKLIFTSTYPETIGQSVVLAHPNGVQKGNPGQQIGIRRTAQETFAFGLG